jgi:pectate lyase
VSKRTFRLLGLCCLSGACGTGVVDWQANGGSAGAPALLAGAGGVGGAAGSSNPTAGSGGGGPGGLGGSAGAPQPTVCADGTEGTEGLTLASLGVALPEPAADAGSSDAGIANPADSGAADAGRSGVVLPGLQGWAAEPGMGTPTTLGGAAGRVVTARTAAELEAFAASPEPLVIRICGTLRAPALEVSSNKTLVGLGRSAALEGGLRLRGTPAVPVHDVVIKNLRVNASVSSVDGAAIQLSDAHHVWIDHCDLLDSADGLLQVVHGSDFVSVSFTKFRFTPNTPDEKHRFACLIGHSDAEEARAEDTGHLKVTLHHNWWADSIRQRAPRVRFGDVHLFNNYYSSAGNDYSVWAALGSRVLLENNYFRRVNNPHELHDADAQLLSVGNVYDGSVGLMQSSASAFTPPYEYAMDAAIDVPDRVTEGAGNH